MRVDKVILRAALSSFAAIATLIGIMIFVLVYLFPATMMNITYDMGFDNASIACAKRSYHRTDEIYYIAFATEVAIVAENAEQITACGKQLVGDNGQAFQEYCQEQNGNLSQTVRGTYDQFIFGQICLAEYNLGDKEQAINDAFSYLNGGFPLNNSVIALLFTAIEGNDSQTVQTITSKLSTLDSSAFSLQDGEYFQDCLTLLGN
jgi:hypothetical protein